MTLRERNEVEVRLALEAEWEFEEEFGRSPKNDRELILWWIDTYAEAFAEENPIDIQCLPD